MTKPSLLSTLSFSNLFPCLYMTTTLSPPLLCLLAVEGGLEESYSHQSHDPFVVTLSPPLPAIAEPECTSSLPLSCSFFSLSVAGQCLLIPDKRKKR
jgi:hypothetical protein